MPFGYNGKILHVDLTQQKWHVEEPGEKWYRTYMGGSNFISYYLLQNLKPGTEALSPENIHRGEVPPHGRIRRDRGRRLLGP